MVVSHSGSCVSWWPDSDHVIAGLSIISKVVAILFNVVETT